MSPSLLLLRPLAHNNDDHDHDDDVNQNNDWDDSNGVGVITVLAANHPGRRLSVQGSDDMDQAIAAKRRQHEKDVMQTIKQAVVPSCYECIVQAKRDLDAGAIQFGAFQKIAGTILHSLPQIKTALYDITQPGTDKYIYTVAQQNQIKLRPYLSIDDLALEWDSDGEGFSKVCTICQDTPKPPVRTLGCMHTFCETCITALLSHEHNIAALSDLGLALADITCPSCKQISYIGAEPERQEKVFNSLMEAYLKDTLKYKCPFDCNKAFPRSELDVHMDKCVFRKYICDQGCGEILHKHQLHADTHGCLYAIRKKLENSEKSVLEKDEQILKKDEKIKKLQAQIESL